MEKCHAPRATSFNDHAHHAPDNCGDKKSIACREMGGEDVRPKKKTSARALLTAAHKRSRTRRREKKQWTKGRGKSAIQELGKKRCKLARSANGRKVKGTGRKIR